MEAKKGRPIIKGVKSKIKKTKRSSIIRGVINYLKSDSYFYSPLINSSSPSDSSANQGFVCPSPGLEAKEPVVQKKGNLKERLLDYMASDAYLYAPFVNDKPEHSAVKTVIHQKGQDLLFEAVTKSMLSRKIVWQTKQVAQDPTSDKQEDRGTKGVTRECDTRILSPNTPGLKEVRKQAVRRSHRLSTKLFSTMVTCWSIACSSR